MMEHVVSVIKPLFLGQGSSNKIMFCVDYQLKEKQFIMTVNLGISDIN